MLSDMMNIKSFLYSLIMMMVLQTGIVAADVHHIIFDEQDNHSLIDPIADDSPDSVFSPYGCRPTSVWSQSLCAFCGCAACGELTAVFI